MKESLDTVDIDSLAVFSSNYTVPLDRLAQHAQTLVGKIAVHELPHVEELVLDGQTWVAFYLSFEQDHTGKIFVRGGVRATLSVECQRCCQPMKLLLEAKTRLVVVDEDEADELEGDDEPLILTGEPIKLGQMIEEEILLQMPLIPRHAADACEWVYQQ